MELLGKNIANYKKSLGFSFTEQLAYDILLQMLSCIETVHSKGYIHRDIKPSNFVICKQEKSVYIVDFGLAKLHLNPKGEPYSERKDCDFRGTIAFASMNAHNRNDLSRRDDMWSFFFVILDLLGETVPWRVCGEDKDEIEAVKNDCINNPEKFLLTNKCNKPQLFEIFYHIKSLKYVDKPDYNLIRNKLRELQSIEITKANLSDRTLMTYIQQSLFSPQNYVPKFNDIIKQNVTPFDHIQKDYTKQSTDISPKQNPLAFFGTVSPFLLNGNQQEIFQNVLNKKRNRSSEITSEPEKNKIQQPSNQSLENNLSAYVFNQMVSHELNMINCINYVHMYNNCLLNKIENDLYNRINSIVDFVLKNNQGNKLCQNNFSNQNNNLMLF